MKSIKDYIFYSIDKELWQKVSNKLKFEFSSKYSFYFWTPAIKSFAPKNFTTSSKIYCYIWCFFHFFRIFANKEFCIFVIYHKDILIHRSFVFPKFFRFPFMAKNDLQIGDTWTHPDFRGKGLALFAVNQICENIFKTKYEKRNQIQKIWYVVDKNNIPSIKVIEKAGFKKIGYGSKKKLFRVNLLAKYIIDEWI